MSQPSQPVQPAHSAAGAQTASSAADSTANSAVMSSAPQSSVTATGSTSFTPKAKVQLFSLALLSFSLGMSQFLIVGMMPSVSAWLRQGTSLNVSASSEQAAQLTAMYSIGIIVGLLLLLLARKLSARWYMVVMGALITVSNLLTFIFGNASTGLFGALLFSRVLAGLPHGSFFGANSLICPRLSPKGKEGQGLSTVVTGQTVADIIGIPIGIALADTIGWANVFLVIVVISLIATVICALTLPDIQIVNTRTQKKGVVVEAMRHLPFWAGLIGIFLGGTGFFTWYNLVSDWAVQNAGFVRGLHGLSSTAWLLAVAGIGMFVGSVLSGRLADKLSPARSTAFGLTWGTIALLLIGLITPRPAWVAYVLVFLATASLFYVSGTPAQLVCNNLTAEGLTGGVIFNLAVNAGNFVGTELGSQLHTASGTYMTCGLVGAAISLVAVLIFLYMIHVENVGKTKYTKAQESNKIAQ